MYLANKLIEIGQDLNIDIKLKKKIHKILANNEEVLDPTCFDDIDEFCSTLSFIIKDICEYLGILPVRMVKKVAAKEKVFLFNEKKIRYYQDLISKLEKFSCNIHDNS